METQRVVVCRLCFWLSVMWHISLCPSLPLSSDFTTSSRCHCTPTFSCSCPRASSCSAATVLQVRGRGLVTHLWKAVRRSAALQVTLSLTFWSACGPNEAVVWADVVAVACRLGARTSSPSISAYTIKFSIENNLIWSVFTFRWRNHTHKHAANDIRLRFRAPNLRAQQKSQRSELPKPQTPTGTVSNTNFQPHTIEVHAACAATQPATICSLRLWASCPALFGGEAWATAFCDEPELHLRLFLSGRQFC